MPYIKQEKRDDLDPAIDQLYHLLVGMEADDENNNMEGNLNYTITRLLRMCYGRSYSEFNSAIGVLNCVILEHYRTQAGPYEDQKKYENGDVDADLPTTRIAEIVVEKKD